MNQTDIPIGTDSSPRSSSAFYGWYVTILMSVVYVLSYIDRQVVYLLIEPIKADIGVSDEQMGYLVGVAFALFYTTMGLPMGWLADRIPRNKLLSVGILIWSASTAASGLAKSFTSLFVARIFVGAGEATLGPCAVSLISDLVPERNRAKAIAVYSSAISIGAGLAYIVGGQVYAWAQATDFSTIPIIMDLRPWQIVFVCFGLPGFLLAAMVMLLTEPRQSLPTTSHTTSSSPYGHFRKHWKLFALVLLFPSVMNAIAHSQAFIAPLFARNWGWNPVELSVYLGAMLLIIAPAFAVLGGGIIDRLHNKGVADGSMRVMQVGILIIIPPAIATPLVPTAYMALGLHAVQLIGINLVIAAGLPTLLRIVPKDMRGISTALYLMVINLTALLLGPTMVGIITDRVFGDEMMLKYSMAIVATVFSSLALVFMPMVIRTYRQALESKQFD